jgi:hypothetical protein
MPMAIPPRRTALDPDTAASPTIDVGKPWWHQKKPWPPDL